MSDTQTSRDAGRGERKVRQGIVVSDGADKTIVVRVERRTTHPLYRKTITKSEKLHSPRRRERCERRGHGAHHRDPALVQEEALEAVGGRGTSEVSLVFGAGRCRLRLTRGR